MKLITLVLTLVLFEFALGGSKEKYDKCQHTIEDITDAEWYYGVELPAIDEDQEVGEIKRYPVNGITKIKSKSKYEKYLKVELNDNELIISTTEAFKNFKQDQEGEKKPTTKIYTKIDIYCDGNQYGKKDYSKLEITQPVNFITKPETCNESIFSENLYLAKYNDKQEFEMMDEISLRSDFKEEITLEQSGHEDYFKVSKTGTRITVHKLKDLPSEVIEKELLKIDITAKNQKSEVIGSTTLAIHIIQANNEDKDEENQNIKPPVFGEHLYFAAYSLKDRLKLNQTITVKYNDSVKINITSQGYEEFFQVSLNYNNNQQIDVENIKPLTSDILENDFIIINIEASNEGLDSPGRTALIVHLHSNNEEEVRIHPPVFSRHLYMANYTSHKLHLQETILIRHGAETNMTVRSKGYEPYFTVSQNPNIKEQIDVKLTQSLPADILQNDFIVIEIQAENVGLAIPGRTALLVSMKNSTQCCFERDGYGWEFGGGNYTFPLLLFAGGITIVIFINIVVLSLYFKAHKMKALNNA